MNQIPPSSLNKEEYPFIKTSDTSLARSIETYDGIVLCQCNGTSIEVRSCLNNLSIDKNAVMMVSKYDSIAKHCHNDYVRQCASDGLVRVSNLLKKVL